MSEQTNEKQIKTSSAKSKKKTEINTLIYCGPTIGNGEIQQNSVYRGEPPEYVTQHWGKSNAVKALFVSPKEFTEMRKNISVQGTRANQLFSEALAYAKGETK